MPHDDGFQDAEDGSADIERGLGRNVYLGYAATLIGLITSLLRGELSTFMPLYGLGLALGLVGGIFLKPPEKELTRDTRLTIAILALGAVSVARTLFGEDHLNTFLYIGPGLVTTLSMAHWWRVASRSPGPTS